LGTTRVQQEPRLGGAQYITRRKGGERERFERGNTEVDRGEKGKGGSALLRWNAGRRIVVLVSGINETRQQQPAESKHAGAGSDALNESWDKIRSTGGTSVVVVTERPRTCGSLTLKAGWRCCGKGIRIDSGFVW
jgi:hypothetical protein